VHPLISKTPDNSVSIPWIGAPAIWSGLGGAGAAGENMRIAIIDTGIDYLHTAFGGPGAGYETNNPTRIGDVAGFPSAKVIGGYGPPAMG
jgi:subtilisin family serine protease